MSKQSFALQQLKGTDPEEAIPALDDIIAADPENEEAYVLRGLKHWALGHRQQAINDYHSALRINPDSKAKTALECVDRILDFYNPDLLNP